MFPEVSHGKDALSTPLRQVSPEAFRVPDTLGLIPDDLGGNCCARLLDGSG